MNLELIQILILDKIYQSKWESQKRGKMETNRGSFKADKKDNKVVE